MFLWHSLWFIMLRGVVEVPEVCRRGRNEWVALTGCRMMKALIQGLWQSTGWRQTQQPLALVWPPSLASPPLPEWHRHVLLAKTNLQFSSSVMLRRRFSAPLLLLSKQVFGFLPWITIKVRSLDREAEKMFSVKLRNSLRLIWSLGYLHEIPPKLLLQHVNLCSFK